MALWGLICPTFHCLQHLPTELGFAKALHDPPLCLGREASHGSHHGSMTSLWFGFGIQHLAKDLNMLLTHQKVGVHRSPLKIRGNGNSTLGYKRQLWVSKHVMEYQLNQNDKECWLEWNQRKRPNYGTKNMLLSRSQLWTIRNMFLFAGMFHLRSSKQFESLVSIETIYQKKQVAINYKVPSFSRSRLKSTKIPPKKGAIRWSFLPILAMVAEH